MFKKTIVVSFILLSACVRPESESESQYNSCMTLISDIMSSPNTPNSALKDMFGTPENKGPCWGKTLSVSTFNNSLIFIVRLPVPGYVTAGIIYENNEIVDFSLTRV